MRIRFNQRPLLWSLPVIVLFGAGGFAFGRHVTIGVQPDGSIINPVGQLLTPAGTHIQVNDRPLGMVLSPDHQVLAVVTGSNFARERCISST